MSFTKFTIRNSTTVFVSIIFIFLFGLTSYISLPREAAPDITIPVVIVNTPYIGVSPADIESLITNPLEEKLKGLRNLDEITSTSADNFSSIVLQFVADTDIEDAVRKVKDKVDQAKISLPAGVNDPQVLEINLSDIPILVFNLSGDYDGVQLKEIADKIKDQLDAIKGVLDVTVSGGKEREIQVIPDANKLRQYHLSFDQLSKMIQSENMNIPGGAIDIGNTKYVIRVPSELKSVPAIQNLVVASSGPSPVYLSDIAEVQDSFKDATTYSRMNRKNCVTISVQKRSGENVIRIADEVKKRLEELKPSLPKAITIDTIVDQSDRIKEMVNELEDAIYLGLVLVCVALFMFLGFTNSIFISIAVPLSMMIGFIFFDWQNITLNMVILFSLIMVLGMLVDDAIVVVENIYRFVENGYDRKTAAEMATKEVAWPVFGATLTIIAAFFPLLFIPGVAGKFMRFLPIGVIVTISASYFVAMVINPVIAATFMKLSSRHRKIEGPREPSRFIQSYERFLKWALANRKLTLLSMVFLFFFSIVIYAITSPGAQFFPETTPDEIYVDIKAPESYTLDATDQATRQIEDQLSHNPHILNISTTVGTKGSSSFEGSYESANIARLIVKFDKKEKRTEDPLKTIEWIRGIIKNVPGIEADIQKAGFGPQSGAPISIQISGDEYKQLVQYSDQIKKIMEGLGGIVDIHDNYVRGKPEILVNIDRTRSAQNNLNSVMISSAIRTSIQGTKASVFRDGIDEYDITLRLPQPQRNTLQRLEELLIPNMAGQPIPLLKVATIKTHEGIGAINHVDAHRVITVEAKPAKGYIASERLKKIQAQLRQFPLEDGYAIRYSGENEHMQEMADYLKKAFFITLLLILMVLIIEFNSVILPLIIMSSIVLSLIGIMLGLTVFHKPFGIIMTGIGIISLAGIVVRNGIILIQYIQELRYDQGLSKYDAVIQGGKTRLRPVLLTAATAILGLVPMTFGINFSFNHFFGNLLTMNPISNLWHSLEIGSQSAEFWGSMGSAMTIGLTVGTVLTLIVVPVLYLSLDDLTEKIKKAIKPKGRQSTQSQQEKDQLK